MKRMSIFLVFIALSVFLTGCYTQFIVPQRYEDDDRYAQQDDNENYNEDRADYDRDSTEAGYRYFDDYQNYQFHYYSPMYSRYFWGYYPGRIGFYDYGNWYDNYWAYGWWNHSSYFYDFYWHNNYPWSYYSWPYYYPQYGYNGGGFSGRTYGYNPFTRERNNDGGRLGLGRGSGDRIASWARTSDPYSGNYGRVTQGRSTSSGTVLGKDASRSGTSTATGTRTRAGEKVYRNYDSGRNRGSESNIYTTPRQLKGTNSSSGSGERSSSERSGRVTNSSGGNGGNYSNPSRSSSSSGSTSYGRSSSSGSSSRGSSYRGSSGSSSSGSGSSGSGSSGSGSSGSSSSGSSGRSRG